DPGPACYGRSLLPTVTDAHVVLGHFPGAALLGGEFKLDAARARAALESLAREMSSASGRRVSSVEAARGVLDVVTTNMERALRIPRVLISPSPGALSALGVLTADVVKEQTRTVMIEASAGAQRELDKVFREMEKQASATLGREGFPASKQRHGRSLAARYK